MNRKINVYGLNMYFFVFCINIPIIIIWYNNIFIYIYLCILRLCKQFSFSLRAIYIVDTYLLYIYIYKYAHDPTTYIARHDLGVVCVSQLLYFSHVFYYFTEETFFCFFFFVFSKQRFQLNFRVLGRGLFVYCI